MRELPVEPNAFPMTPHSPTPAVQTTGSGAAPSPSPVPETLSEQRASTQMVTPLMNVAIEDEPAPAEPDQPEPASVAPAPKRNIVPILLGGAATIGVVALIASFLGRGGTGTAANEQAASEAASADSAAAAALNDSLLDRSDTTVVRLGVNPITVTLAVGDSTQLKALAFGPSGESVRRPVRWTSSDTLAVRVNADGWIRALTRTKPNDPVFITATAANKSSVSVVNVK